MECLGKIIDDIYPKSVINRIRNTVRAIVVNEYKQVALLHIVCVDDFGERNHYETPGGGVEKDETLINALHREIKEELGYTIKNIKEIGYVDIEYNILSRIDRGHFFYCEVDEFIGQNLMENEVLIIKEIKWININEIDELYLNTKVYNVGYMVHKRDLLAFNKIKELGLY